MDYNEITNNIEKWQRDFETAIERLSSGKYTDKDAREIWERLQLWEVVIAGFLSFIDTTAKKEYEDAEYSGYSKPLIETVKGFKTSVLESALAERARYNFEKRNILLQAKNKIISNEAKDGLLSGLVKTENWKKSNEFMFTTVDKNGKTIRLRPENYASTINEVVKSNARLDKQVDFIQSSGSDVAIIPTNRTTKDACIKFQGKFVSISGKTKKIVYNNKEEKVLSLPELRTGRYHIFHPHCHHFDIRPIYNYQTIA